MNFSSPNSFYMFQTIRIQLSFQSLPLERNISCTPVFGLSYSSFDSSSFMAIILQNMLHLCLDLKFSMDIVVKFPAQK